MQFVQQIPVFELIHTRGTILHTVRVLPRRLGFDDSKIWGWASTGSVIIFLKGGHHCDETRLNWLTNYQDWKVAFLNDESWCLKFNAGIPKIIPNLKNKNPYSWPKSIRQIFPTVLSVLSNLAKKNISIFFQKIIQMTPILLTHQFRFSHSDWSTAASNSPLFSPSRASKVRCTTEASSA